MLFQTMSQLGDTFQGIIKISNGNVRVLDPSHIHGPLLDRLVWTGAFHEKVEMRGTARWLIKMFAPAFGIDLKPASSLRQFSANNIQVIAIKGMSYDVARTFFRSARPHQLETVLFISAEKEQAREMAILTAAAIQEGFQGHLLLQGKSILSEASSGIALETLLKRSQNGKQYDIGCSEETEPGSIKITISVFSQDGIDSKKREAFLWSRPATLREQIATEIGTILQRFFKKSTLSEPLQMIQEKGIIDGPSFILREEITAAISESEAGTKQVFWESFSG